MFVAAALIVLVGRTEAPFAKVAVRSNAAARALTLLNGFMVIGI